MKTKPRSMFVDTLRIEAGKDLVHLGLMDCGPDGLRPEEDGETLSITVPLSQFEPLMDDFTRAFDSRAYARRVLAPGIEIVPGRLGRHGDEMRFRVRPRQLDENPGRRTFVVAGNQTQYGQYCRSKGLRPGRDVVYVAQDETLMGFTSADFLLIGKYWTHTHWARIEQAIRSIPDHTVRIDHC